MKESNSHTKGSCHFSHEQQDPGCTSFLLYRKITAACFIRTSLFLQTWQIASPCREEWGRRWAELQRGLERAGVRGTLQRLGWSLNPQPPSPAPSLPLWNGQVTLLWRKPFHQNPPCRNCSISQKTNLLMTLRLPAFILGWWRQRGFAAHTTPGCGFGSTQFFAKHGNFSLECKIDFHSQGAHFSSFSSKVFQGLTKHVTKYELDESQVSPFTVSVKFAPKWEFS